MFRRLLCGLLALSGVAIAGHDQYVTGFVIVNFNLTNNRKPPKPVVRGKVFDRFVSIWLENTNFADAVADREFCYTWQYIQSYQLLFSANLAKLVKQGILLENYFATTHPSEPNYVAVAGGDNFGMDNDNLTEIPANVSTVVDLLESKGITWAEYQEGMPSSGFTGFQFLNPDGANMYVRKHKWVITDCSTFRYPLFWHFTSQSFDYL
jgi:acid phosphatase